MKGSLEMHIVQLIARPFHCDSPHRFDIVLFIRSNETK